MTSPNFKWPPPDYLQALISKLAEKMAQEGFGVLSEVRFTDYTAEATATFERAVAPIDPEQHLEFPFLFSAEDEGGGTQVSKISFKLVDEDACSGLIDIEAKDSVLPGIARESFDYSLPIEQVAAQLYVWLVEQAL